MNVSFIYNYDTKKDDWEYRYTISAITQIPRVGEKVVIHNTFKRTGQPEKMIDGIVTSVTYIITHRVMSNGQEDDVFYVAVYVSGDYHNPKVIKDNNG